jgi:hypothetical protein
MTPHCATKSQYTIKPERADQKNSYARRCRSDSVREKIQRQPDALEDVLEHCNDLERKYILSAVVSDFENGLLPDIILRVCFISLPLGNCVGVDIHDRPSLANFECGHERCLWEFVR